MAVIESVNSRQFHSTKEGATITQIFHCLGTDLPYAGINGLPLVGYYWQSYTSELRCTDIQVFWLDGSNCRVEALYSTRGSEYIEERPNKIPSWRCGFDFSVEGTDLDTYLEYATNNTTNWEAEYWAVKGEGIPPAPPVTVYKPKIIYWDRIFLPGFSFTRMKNLIGGVNNQDFLKQLRDYYQGQRPIPYYVEDTADDTGHWLLAAMKVDMVGQDNWEIYVEYWFSYDGWNSPYNVPINYYNEVNLHIRNLPQLPA